MNQNIKTTKRKNINFYSSEMFIVILFLQLLFQLTRMIKVFFIGGITKQTKDKNKIE